MLVFTTLLSPAFLLMFSDAIRQRKVLLLPFPYQRSTVDLATDALLHHLSPVELSTGVYCLHTHSSQVQQLNADSSPLSLLMAFSEHSLQPVRFKGSSSFIYLLVTQHFFSFTSLMLGCPQPTFLCKMQLCRGEGRAAQRAGYRGV